jgi:hypothetical protein
MVAAVVVVVGSAVVTSLCAVPDVRKLRHRGGLLFVIILDIVCNLLLCSDRWYFHYNILGDCILYFFCLYLLNFQDAFAVFNCEV